MHYLRYDNFRPAPPTWAASIIIYISLYFYHICVFNLCHQWLWACHLRINDRRERMMDLISRWLMMMKMAHYISAEREDAGRAPYASQLVELTFQPRSANPPVCDNKGECVWLMGSLCYQRAIAHTCNYVPHALYDIGTSWLFHFYIFFRFMEDFNEATRIIEMRKKWKFCWIRIHWHCEMHICRLLRLWRQQWHGSEASIVNARNLNHIAFYWY